MFSAYEVELKNWTSVNDFSNKYHFIFPEYKYIDDYYWKLLTKHLFEVIILEKHAFFPVCVNQSVMRNKRKKTVFKFKWVPLGRIGEQDLGYFNTLKKLKWEVTDQYALESILKELDMNIIHTPVTIKKSMEGSGIINLSVTTPEAIVSFLTTYKTGPCYVGEIDCLLDKTKIQNTTNLCLLLQSITNAENFSENVDELPILLTEDNRLHTFKKDMKLYTSKYFWMFPGSEKLFIHNKLTLSYPIQKLIQKGSVRPFTCTVFKELIPDHIRYKLNQNSVVKWNESLKNVVHARWIKSFWEFLYLEYTQIKSETTFKEFVRDFDDWSVLPSRGMHYDNLLIKIADGFELLDVTSFPERLLFSKKVRELGFPTLDSRIFLTENLTDRDTTCATYVAVLSLITSHGDPQMFLKCLYAHSERLQKHFLQDVEPNDALVILEYFSRSLENETLLVNKQAITMLKSLPLYETHDGFLIMPLSKAYEVPSNVPAEGLSEFAKRLHLNLLKNRPSLEVLYKAVSVQKVTSGELYVNVILPNIRCLPRPCWIEHVTHIKDNELQTGVQNLYSNNQQLIIDALRCVDFIETEIGPKTCDFFFNHENPVFKIMCTSHQFLPSRFRSKDWVSFIALLGMPMKVTDELIIQFSNEVANNKLNDDTKEKSEVVLNCFLEGLHAWRQETFQSICEISFIVPKKLCDFQSNICQQKYCYKGLICMRDSVQAKDIDICWSTMDVLPFEIEERNSQQLMLLGIHSFPPLLAVLRHFQNISTAIANNIKTATTKRVNQLMIKMYDFLVKHGKFPKSKNMLEQFPIIHLPSENKIVKVNSVVLNLSQDQELKPYLYKAPVFYGRFFDLFQNLGTSVNVQFCHYLHVLEQLYAETHKNLLTVQELGTVKCVLQQIQTYIKQDSVDCKGKNLYLPNEKKCLCLSTELTIWDNEFLKERMKMEKSITYFIGFRNVCPSIKDPVGFVKNLPSAIRPKLLSMIIDEKLNIDRNSINQHSTAAYRIMSFIQSQEFIVGVCRIKKHHNESFDTENDIRKIKELLYRIRILEVSTLETFLVYRGQKVENSDEQCEFFHEEETRDGEKFINFFFKEISGPVELGIIDILSSGIAKVILHAANIPTDASIKLLEIMRKIRNPETISRVLDKEQYPMLEVESQLDGRSAFPRPGSYVEEYFHPFLVMTLDNFEESEYRYVALELEDEEMDVDSGNANNNGIYIYVHIVDKLHDMTSSFSAVHTKYLVDTGCEQYEEIPAYRLFRFVRQIPMSDEMQTYDLNVPQENLPFDENCRQIRNLLMEAWSLPEIERRRIIRRLCFQWHPDKNQGLEDYATRVFHYIQQVLLQLERDEDLLVQDSVDGQAPEFEGSSYSAMFQKLHKRAKTYVSAYHENLDDYNRCHRTGHYNHVHSSAGVYRDINEARRWMRQANCDYQAALAFIERADEPKAYNWICYTCHQVDLHFSCTFINNVCHFP